MTRRLLHRAVVPVLLALAGCRVGLSVDVGPGDDAPEVSLAVAPQAAAPGGTVELVAAASDDYVVREVRFYRADAAGDVLLGRDALAPYALQTAVPAGAAGEVRYFARAEDDAGQVTESAVVVVTVR
ncbi:MAG TPA: hypothetical protein VFQ16_13725 [Burkholderiaceae bacterium]|nr:hypothetical protein [Burkholderiaceae bacterium]